MLLNGRRLTAAAGFGLAALLFIMATGMGTGLPLRAEPLNLRVSVDQSGGDPDGASTHPSMSGSGRYVAFESLASDLVPNDANGTSDVFVRDLATGMTIRPSVDTDGSDANGPSHDPSISLDGRYVAFDSDASDLVTGDGNGKTDVFVRDLATGMTVRASVASAGGDTNDWSAEPSISADGAAVAFSSVASNLVSGDANGIEDVFVRDLGAGTTVRASVDVNGVDSNDSSSEPAMSPDGRFVAFSSSATDLVPEGGNGWADIYLRDLLVGSTVRVSVDRQGSDPFGGDSIMPAVSRGATFVAFASDATNLVLHDHNDRTDVFLRDLVNVRTLRVSTDATGGDADGESWGPSITSDGRFVAFASTAKDLVAPGGLATTGATPVDIFLRDTGTGSILVASVDGAGGEPTGNSGHPAVGSTGRYVVFDSLGWDFVPGDGNSASDIYLRQTT